MEFNGPASRYCQPPYVIYFIYSCLANNVQEHKLDVSFSRVKYIDIAPLVGLEPYYEDNDIKSFAMSRARLPDIVFQQILVELHNLSLQYGTIRQQRNEEARSRFLCAVKGPAYH